VADCYNLTLKAFDLAEQFRVPVIILSDKEIGLTKTTVDSQMLDYRERSHPTGSGQIKRRSGVPDLFIEGGSRPIFGGKRLVRLTTSSHDQQGYLTKDPSSIQEHNQHLVSKIMDHLDEISMVAHDLDEGSDTLIISYGITSKAVDEAVRLSRENGCPISSLTIYSLWPVPEEHIKNALQNSKRIIIPELNLGLYRQELERFIKGDQEIISINRLDGGQISPQEILDALYT
jgi:2-oxoglutarate ferredoxin oxidoreductase subunit alpha